MRWRDDVARSRWCSSCGQKYYGELGHRDCPARPERFLFDEDIERIQREFGIPVDSLCPATYWIVSLDRE